MGYKTREWRNSMRVTLDYNNMTEKFLGDKGFSDKKLASYASKANAAFRFVKENRGKDAGEKTKKFGRISIFLLFLSADMV